MRLVSRTFRRVSARYFVTDVRAFTHTYCHVIRVDTWLLYILYKYIYDVGKQFKPCNDRREQSFDIVDGRAVVHASACEHDHI